MEYINLEFSILLVRILFLFIIFHNVLDMNRSIDTKIVNYIFARDLYFDYSF